jgi:hypothetical protein
MMSESDERVAILKETIACWFHDIRAPASRAMGYADLLRHCLESEENATPEEMKQYAEETTKAIKQLFEMLEEYLVVINST